MPLRLVRCQKRRRRLSMDDGGQLPSQVLCTPNGCVDSKPFVGRHGMSRITKQEDTSLLELIRHPFSRLPVCNVYDLNGHLLTNGLQDQVLTPFGSEFSQGFSFFMPVGDGKQTEILFGGYKHAKHIRV